VREMLGTPAGEAAGGPAGEPPARQFLVTDATERFRRVAGEFLEQEIAHLELVTL